MDSNALAAGTRVELRCKDGVLRPADLVELPMYDTLGEIPRGKRVDIPERR